MKRYILLLLTYLLVHYAAATTTIPLYFCTAATDDYYYRLINLIASIHATNFDNLQEIAVFDLGLSQQHKNELSRIQRVKLYQLERNHPHRASFFKRFRVPSGHSYFGWYAWKLVVIKQALELFPYVLWVDAGTTIMRSLDHLFEYIQEEGHFACTIGDELDKNGNFLHPIGWQTTRFVGRHFDLYNEQYREILNREAIMAGVIGASRQALPYLFMPLYELTKDLRYFIDDGTTPIGYGTARPEQNLLGIMIYRNNLAFFVQDHTQKTPMLLPINNHLEPLYITWHPRYVSRDTHIYSSRNDTNNFKHYERYIRYRR